MKINFSILCSLMKKNVEKIKISSKKKIMYKKLFLSNFFSSPKSTHTHTHKRELSKKIFDKLARKIKHILVPKLVM